MKISLIIPAHNEEKFIGECLEYVVKNSKNKLHEIIVVDNRSTDRTREVAEKFEGVKVFFEEKKGVNRARQKGYESSSGDILAFIDADTRMPEGWVEEIEKEFQLNKDLAGLSGPYFYHDISIWNKFWVWCYWHILGMPVYFITRYMMIGGNFAIRRTTLEKMDGFDTAIEFYGDDTNTARRASRFGKVKFKLSFPMYTSGRRLKKQGVWYTAFIYAINYSSEVLLKRPITEKYEDHR